MPSSHAIRQRRLGSTARIWNLNLSTATSLRSSALRRRRSEGVPIAGNMQWRFLPLNPMQNHLDACRRTRVRIPRRI
jgi:hypothetical protein